MDGQPPDRARANAVTRRWATVARTGAAVALGLILITAGTSRPYFPFWVVLIPFLLVFPVWFWTIFAGNRHTAATGEDSILRLWPRSINWRLPLIAVAYVNAAVLVGSSLGALGGQPEKHHGHYYLNNHGSLTKVPQSEYYRAEIASERLFLGLSAAFLGVGALVNGRIAQRSA